jgi:hypothetical protein
LKPYLFAAIFVNILITAITNQAVACTNPNGNKGDLVYNLPANVVQFCNGNNWIAAGDINPAAGSGTCSAPTGDEGDIVYNETHDVMQFCNGEDWIAMGSYGDLGICTPPASCTNIGDVCSDGSLFAGFLLYNNSSCEPLFVTNDNQSASSQWKNATGTNDISTDDYTDGKTNATNRGGSISNFPAFELCESNAYHGKSDWYLPARAELNLLWLNKVAIDANANGNFNSSAYWSSTESSVNGAWAQDFSNGYQDWDNKSGGDDVRCVRRE